MVQFLGFRVEPYCPAKNKGKVEDHRNFARSKMDMIETKLHVVPKEVEGK